MLILNVLTFKLLFTFIFQNIPTYYSFIQNILFFLKLLFKLIFCVYILLQFYQQIYIKYFLIKIYMHGSFINCAKKKKYAQFMK